MNAYQYYTNIELKKYTQTYRTSMYIIEYLNKVLRQYLYNYRIKQKSIFNTEQYKQEPIAMHRKTQAHTPT